MLKHPFSNIKVVDLSNYIAGALCPGLLADFGAEVLVDVEASWTFRDRYAVKLGVENVFDSYPDPGDFEVCCGRIYRSDSIVPWQGTLAYLQLAWSSP